MRRSLNEVYRACQKASEGAGAPDGLDVEVARGTVWLLARGLPVLDVLLRELERVASDSSACRFEQLATEAPALDTASKSGAVLAPSIVGLLVARAARGGDPGRFAAMSLSAPLYLLPATADYVREGWRFRFGLKSPHGERLVLRNHTAGAEVLASPAATLSALYEGEPFELDAVCGRDGLELAADGGALEAVLTVEALAQREANSLAQGVDITPELWRRLSHLAAKVLVPATAASRERGAGAGARDSE